MTTDRNITDIDIASSLSQMTESTTAAELVRRQGQTRKVKVVSERKLMEWILALLKQHMAAKEDNFSDQEKAELLRKTQDELAKRIQRQQTAEREQAQAQEQLEQAMTRLAEAHTNQDMSSAVEALRARLVEAENRSQDLQQDNFEMQDQLQEKLALLSTTIIEKNKLRDTVRQQMIRSGQLVEGVIRLDEICYGSKHVTENPVNEEASAEERFFQDFAVGCKIIAALGDDLERMRGPATPHIFMESSPTGLIEQVTHAVEASAEVAGPVGDLVSALESAREETMTLRQTVAEATGARPTQTALSAVPDADGDAGQVLGGATTILREITGELIRSRNSFVAMHSIADAADSARNQTETELEALKQASEQLLAAVAFVGQQQAIPAGPAIDDTTLSVEQRLAAATTAINALADNSHHEPELATAITEQVKRAERLAKETGIYLNTSVPASSESRVMRLRSAGECLENLVRNQEKLLEAAAAREKALTEQIQVLNQLRGTKGDLKDIEKEITGAKTIRLADSPAKNLATEDVRSIEKLVAYSKQQATALANVTAERDQAKKNLAAVTELLRSAQGKIEELRTANKKK